jgi:uncharacterized protein
MLTDSDEPLISCFLLKVASRCNINCDYCYMYNHLDQGWKLQPKLMSERTLIASAERIAEYVKLKKVTKIAIVYHGGEPLLLGSKNITAHAGLLRKLLPLETLVDFTIQTNGVLLREEDIINFQKHELQVSISLDGPESVHDRHRLDSNGKSTFKETANALSLLMKYPSVFAGIIAVIDTKNSPKEILNFFTGIDIPQLDFLLPDANYITQPPGKELDKNVYTNWLINCFDLWFDNYSFLKIRTFDTIIASLMGLPSETDGLGLGDISLITIETDGTYHDLDVLKITGTGTNLQSGDVHSNPVSDATISERISFHRNLLKKKGLSLKCQECEIVDICGGGAVGHRYSEEGYSNPSIYCEELKHLIQHVKLRVTAELQSELEIHQPKPEGLDFMSIKQFEQVTGLSDSFLRILSCFEENQEKKFSQALEVIDEEGFQVTVADLKALSLEQYQNLAIQPSVVAWTEVILKNKANIAIHSIDGNEILPDPLYINQIKSLTSKNTKWPSFQRDDKWLKLPFGNKIFFENSSIYENGRQVIEGALLLIKSWKPSILEEMKLISPEIQFIRDLSAHEDKVVSFSDNSVPGALYVQLKVDNGYISPSDLADSIIHEHRHQRLYLLQRMCPILNADFPLVASPWREELRPPSGLFHALYVFIELLDFWKFLKDHEDKVLSINAEKQCMRIYDQLQLGFEVVANSDLTEEGRFLLKLLNDRFLSYN